MYGLLAIAGLAFIMRAGLVLWLASAGDTPYTYEHGVIAENLLAGNGFSIRFLGVEGATSQQGPLYPALLAALYAVFGVGSPTAIVAMQLLQCAAGAILVVALAHLAWSLIPERPAAGWLCALVAALLPTHIYMVTHIQVVVWAATTLVVLLAVVANANAMRSWLRGAVAGVLAGVLMLIEPILALAVPVAALLLYMTQRKKQRQTHGRGAWACVAVMTVAAVVVVGPWILRNRAVHGEWVFIKSTFGYALWQGNNPLSWGTDKIPNQLAAKISQGHDGTLASRHQALRAARLKTQYIDDVALAVEGYGQFEGLTEPQRSRRLAHRAYRFIAEQPTRYASLCFQRLRYFMLFDETNPKTVDPIYRATTVAWLVLAAVGFLATLGQWRRLWPTYAIFAAVALFHTLTITSVRFRIVIEPLSLVWIAVALEPLLIHLQSPLRWAANLRTGKAQPQTAPAAPLAGPHYLRGNRGGRATTADNQVVSVERQSDVSRLP